MPGVKGGQGQNMTRSTIFFNFRCGKPNGDEVIQAFLDKAYNYYQVRRPTFCVVVYDHSLANGHPGPVVMR